MGLTRYGVEREERQRTFRRTQLRQLRKRRHRNYPQTLNSSEAVWMVRTSRCFRVTRLNA